MWTWLHEHFPAPFLSRGGLPRVPRDAYGFWTQISSSADSLPLPCPVRCPRSCPFPSPVRTSVTKRPWALDLDSSQVGGGWQKEKERKCQRGCGCLPTASSRRSMTRSLWALTLRAFFPRGSVLAPRVLGVPLDLGGGEKGELQIFSLQTRA